MRLRKGWSNSKMYLRKPSLIYEMAAIVLPREELVHLCQKPGVSKFSRENKKGGTKEEAHDAGCTAACCHRVFSRENAMTLSLNAFEGRVLPSDPAGEGAGSEAIGKIDG